MALTPTMCAMAGASTMSSPACHSSKHYLAMEHKVLTNYAKITRFVVLEDVNGKMVTIAILAPTVQFDESWLNAHRVLHTVEWEDT